MSTLDLHVDRGVATLTLGRPDSLNALNLELAAELVGLIRDVGRRDDVDVLVLAAQGRAFCAGGDVAEMAASGDPSGYLLDLTRDVHEAIALIHELPIPVVARVQGPVAGGGLGLMLSADVVVCADGVTFTPAYGAIGLSPDCGTTVLLPAAVGERRAREMLLLGRRLDAATALDWGLVAEVSPTDALDGRVDAAIERIRGAGRFASVAVRRLLSRSHADFRQSLADEAASISALAATDLARERIERFVRR